MPVSEVITFEVQKQLLNERSAPAEANASLEADVSLQMNGEDVVTLSFSNEQGLSQDHSEVQVESGVTVQEISSVAQAASTFSQVIEADLNDDELAAIQKIAAKIEPIARDFLSSSPEEFNIEQAVDIALTDVTLVETESSEVDFENIRQFPSLVSATIDAGFEKQFQTLNAPSRELIVNSLRELMQFFREKIVQVLEPLRYPSASKESGSEVPVEVDLVAQS